MGITTVRSMFIGLVAAGALTVGTAGGAAAAQPALAPLFACQAVPGAPLINNICASISNGQIRGTLLHVSNGTLTVDDIFLAACNAANTSCTEVPGSHATLPSTPTLPATPGQNYKSCVFFHLRFGVLDNRDYSGCSPLVSS
jgi:hypothetical protein